MSDFHKKVYTIIAAFLIALSVYVQLSLHFQLKIIKFDFTQQSNKYHRDDVQEEKSSLLMIRYVR